MHGETYNRTNGLTHNGTVERSDRQIAGWMSGQMHRLTRGWVNDRHVSHPCMQARMKLSIGVIGLLTLSAKMASVMTKLPRFAGSVWLLNLFQISFFFVFSCIAQFAIVNVLVRIEGRVSKKVGAAEQTLRNRAEQVSSMSILSKTTYQHAKCAGRPSEWSDGPRYARHVAKKRRLGR